MQYEPVGIEKIILRLLLTTVVATQCINLADAAADLRAAGIAGLSSCELPGVSRPARCGVFNLPEDPDRPAGRQLSIHVAVVPAAGDKSLPDPIVPLMGGPGEDAISSAAHYVVQLSSLLVDRDLLLIDQRGTGQSGAFTM